MTLSWNLMCRISNSIDVHFSHIDWKEDALAIIFCHMKNDQQGERPRDPRHIYANPLIPEVCPVLSLGVYLLCFPPSPECTQLFPGHKQDDRYSKILKRLLTLPDHVEEVRTMGINPDDIGTHSIRKGASTFTASGSTAAHLHPRLFTFEQVGPLEVSRIHTCGTKQLVIITSVELYVGFH